MKLTSEKALEILNSSRGLSPDDNWIEHSICVGNTAGKIAKCLKLDVDKAKTLGYIHDIGKRFGFDGLLAHVVKGFDYIKSLGYDEEYASTCLTHSFLNNDINCVAGGIPSKTGYKYEFAKKYVETHEYTIYEKIINLCDLTCKINNMTLEERLQELINRHGIYENTKYHYETAQKLKLYFDNLLEFNLYDLYDIKTKSL